MRNARIERLLKLIQALHSSRSCTVDELKQLFGVSRRTVFRDLGLLTRAGIPHSRDPVTRRYSTSSTLLLPPVSLTHAEALTLMLATRYLLRQYAPDQSAAAAACMKIESVLPASIRDYCGPLMERIEVRPGPASDSASIAGVFATLQTALAGRVKVEVRYDSYYDGCVIEGVLHPYRLVYIHRGWYVIAYSEQHREVRTFKVERILLIKLLDKPFTMGHRFTLDKYFDHAWNMIRGGKRYHVRIRFLKKVASNVDEITWHKTQHTSYEDDGSLLFEADVDGVDEIAWWVLGYGDQARVLDPPELRKIIAAHAKRMSAYYGETARSEQQVSYEPIPTRVLPAL